ncbi:hypothetical protein [Deinococcus misasensis]|uniref:hypothetical protein n=1 Tax=Deinococcus misasensis TaxID=392413 RepID=UPI00055718F8|nr:hypothetical protein [Deinococcus misasensis]
MVLRGLQLLYWAVVLAVLSLQVHYPLGEAARGADCLPECMDPTEQWGFPLLYIRESFSTSMGRDFQVWPFVLDVGFYLLLLVIVRKGLRFPAWNRPSLIRVVLWFAFWLLFFWVRVWWMLWIPILLLGLLVVLNDQERPAFSRVLSVVLMCLGGALVTFASVQAQGISLTGVMLGAALCLLGGHLPVVWTRKAWGKTLLVVLLAFWWWFDLLNGAFSAALATSMYSGMLAQVFALLWISMFVAPDALMNWIHQTKNASKSKRH